MDILMSLHKQWASKIFNKTKTLEFRKNIGKDFNVGDIVYIYETSKNNGRKMIVGQFTIKDIVKIDQSSGCGTYDLLPFPPSYALFEIINCRLNKIKKQIVTILR